MYDEPETVWLGVSDAAWHTLDVSSVVDSDSTAVIVRVTTPTDLQLNYWWWSFGNLRQDSAGYIQSQYYQMAANNTNRGVLPCSIWVVSLTAARTFDYRLCWYSYGGGSEGASWLQVIGEIKPASGVSGGFDLIPLNSTNGRLINGGTASAWTTVDPDVIPSHAIGFLGSVAGLLTATGANGTINVYLRGGENFRASGHYSSLASNSTSYSIHMYQTIFQPIYDGKFQYYRSENGLTSQADVYLFAPYIVVPVRKGQSGYRMGNGGGGLGLVVNYSGGAVNTWTKATVSGAKPGDLVLLSVFGQKATGSTGGTISTYVRECLTEDHQPFYIQASDPGMNTYANYLYNSAWVRLDDNCQFEWKAPGSRSYYACIYVKEIIPRVKL